MSARKLWGLRFDDAAPWNPIQKYMGRKNVYRAVDAYRQAWQNGRASQHLTVYLDERDGRDWQVYERIDLSVPTPVVPQY